MHIIVYNKILFILGGILKHRCATLQETTCYFASDPRYMKLNYIHLWATLESSCLSVVNYLRSELTPEK